MFLAIFFISFIPISDTFEDLQKANYKVIYKFKICPWPARVAKCQIFYTEQIFQTEFYPKKSAQIATNLAPRRNKINTKGYFRKQKLNILNISPFCIICEQEKTLAWSFYIHSVVY